MQKDFYEQQTLQLKLYKFYLCEDNEYIIRYR